ncbi:MAG: hypothetical protein HQL31_07565, partial [Planctomycetes bacterium]|nr:hypothetical protein [Planctomycetota bacterium]
NDAWKYKDHNYSFEEEIRGQIEFDANDPETSDLMRDTACEFPELYDFIYVPVSADFIEEICFDPRCPAYKTAIYKEIIDPASCIPTTVSEAFGSILEHTTEKHR